MSDRDFLTLCKSLIAERYLLGTPDGHWRQRDLEALSRIIEDKSGIRISLSTLKRLWRSNINQTPHPATLDALASLLECEDWLSFKNKYQQSVAEPNRGTAVKNWMVWIVILLALILVGFLVLAPEINEASASTIRTPIASGPVTFTANKTIATGVPNTVIFKYDLSNIAADSFYLQQSWNETHRVAIDPLAGNYSSTYYTPGFHRAKLLANDSIFKVARIHIKTEGWLPLVKYDRNDLVPVYLRDRRIISGGQMQVTPDQLQAAGVDTERNFILNYHNVRSFDETESANFQFKSRVRADSMGNYACPQISVTMVCEEGIFYVPLTTLGCVGNIGVKFGENTSNGTNSDLSAFGTKVYDWQDLHIAVRNQIAQVHLNQKLIYESSYELDYGLLMGLVISFTGSGSVDYTEILDASGAKVYKDTFL